MASSTTIEDAPLIKTVTALDLAQPSITNILSLVVPNYISLIFLADPNFLASISSNLGTILAPVATANNSISTPPTHLTAGKSFYNKRWLASSSNPH